MVDVKNPDTKVLSVCCSKFWSPIPLSIAYPMMLVNVTTKLYFPENLVDG